MIRISQLGDFKKIEDFLMRMRHGDLLRRLEPICEAGVVALARATPVDSGKTANSWGYEIKPMGDGVVVYWTNDNIINGFNVATGLQYGHGTGFGGYVRGIDYINPAMAPIFQKIADDIWQEVTRS